MSHANRNTNRNTPHTVPDGDSGHDIDVVPGDPAVPITVWRTPRGADGEDTAIPARLAQRLVAAYTRAGEAVIDLTAGHAVTAAALAGGRRCHRAWFTDASAVIIGPHTGAATSGEPRRHLARGRDEPPTAGSASLVMASWPLDTQAAGSRARLAALLTACGEMLRPSGCLVMVAANPPPAAPEDLTDVVAAAKRAGLGYLQHIVAARADVHGDQFVYHATDDELAALAPAADGGEPTRVHLPVHADLFVFTRPGGVDA